jgi:hypothetical protein
MLAAEKYDEMGNGSEEMVLRVRKPAMKLGPDYSSYER